jgi:methoxymalonate biosynthesis acyl carrier protein
MQGRAGMDNKAKVKRFLSGFFRTDNLQEQDDIFAMGFVNSLFAMQLVLHIEQEFKIAIADEDLDINNFNSINNIVAFISRKSAIGTGA